MKVPCTGVILAGGLNKRFSGKNKAFVPIGKKSILSHIEEVFNDIFQEIILVTNDPVQYFPYDFNIVTDLYMHRSSMTGIHAGLFYSTNPFSFICACDTPFLNKELVKTIIDNIDVKSDVIVPETSKGLEPLCAVYSKRCISFLENNLNNKKFKIKKFYSSVKVKKLPENLIREKDENLLSFVNINDDKDLAEAKQLFKLSFIKN